MFDAGRPWSGNRRHCGLRGCRAGKRRDPRPVQVRRCQRGPGRISAAERQTLRITPRRPSAAWPTPWIPDPSPALPPIPAASGACWVTARWRSIARTRASILAARIPALVRPQGIASKIAVGPRPQPGLARHAVDLHGRLQRLRQEVYVDDRRQRRPHGHGDLHHDRYPEQPLRPGLWRAPAATVCGRGRHRRGQVVRPPPAVVAGWVLSAICKPPAPSPSTPFYGRESGLIRASP